jgi:hypothetical protein
MRKERAKIRLYYCSVFIVALFLLGLSGCSSPPPVVTVTSTILKTTAPAVPTASKTAEPSSPAFPRLGMWWPNCWHQPLTEVARYDWVILGDYQEEFIDPLRAIKPDIVLLTDTDALELHYYPDDPASNEPILKIPYQWFLTQVGSTLSQDIDAVQSILPVVETELDDGKQVIDLFREGDTVLIENESVYVQSVDKARKTLIVERGYVRPAASHKAGARIAAHVSTWPSTWMLNVSTLSPTAVEDPAIGPEIWPEYNARIGAQLLADPRWSGILVDRSETEQARYIDGSAIRSLDPDQSNRLLKDYTEFDSTWSDGLRLYLDKLRQAVGPDRIIYLNWGIEEYQTVNGDNFEGFPDEAGALGENTWHDVVFGPFHRGSYFNWVSLSPQPNITMIETYEDNTVPSGSYDNPCEKAGFTPNYRKMRFGLTTALLNDGYFSYEMNTDGHGSLCLMWFDEYDNAGAGRGYLGYPLGEAYQVTASRLSSHKKGLDIWQRDYEGGTVLVNSTDEAVTISLEGTFRKIKGSQDPAINDGSLVTELTLQPKDGIILLRP